MNFQLLIIIWLAMQSNHPSHGFKTKEFKESHETSVAGQVISDPSGTRRLSCSSRCLQTHTCLGILFGKDIQNAQERCKRIGRGSDCTDTVNLTSWSQYKYLKPQPSMKKACPDVGIGVATPSGWGSDCPTLYFPLDTVIPGGPQGEDSSNIQFASGGKVGNALYNPATESAPESWYELGAFPQPQYCFVDPETCDRGMSVAFWLKIISTGSASHGIITTATQNGPGFSVVRLNQLFLLFF